MFTEQNGLKSKEEKHQKTIEKCRIFFGFRIVNFRISDIFSDRKIASDRIVGLNPSDRISEFRIGSVRINVH